MSVEATSNVWKCSRARGSALCIMLALADYANHDGQAWPAIETLAQKARVSPRTVQKEIKTLARMGEISISEGTGPNGVNVYTITLGGGAIQCARRRGGAQSSAKNPCLGAQNSATGLRPNRQEPSYRRTVKNTPASSQGKLAVASRTYTARSPRPKPPPDPSAQISPGPLFGQNEPPQPTEPSPAVVVRDAFVERYKHTYRVTPKWGPAEAKAAKRVWDTICEAVADKPSIDRIRLLRRVIEMYLADPDRDLFLRRNSHRFLLLANRVPGYLLEALGRSGGVVIPEGRW